MCRAMNRSMTNVLFGAFGSATAAAAGGEQEGSMREVGLDDIATQLAYANKVVFVPVMDSQPRRHNTQCASSQTCSRSAVSPLNTEFIRRGPHARSHERAACRSKCSVFGTVQLEQINPEFPTTDVAVVIGANDVVNPDARDNPTSPIAGMPILEVDRSKSVVVLKRGQGKGFSGLENPLFFKPVTGMLYGDAKDTLTRLVQAVQHA